MAILKFVGKNGVALKEEFSTMAMNFDQEKGIRSVTFQGKGVDPSFLEEFHYILYSMSENQEILHYDKITVDPEEQLPSIVFENVYWVTFDYQREKAKVKIVFNFLSFKTLPIEDSGVQ
jgi:hypothetical protein